MANPHILSRFRVVDNMLRADVVITGTADPDNATIEIPVGTYYLDSPTASESLVEAIDAALEAAYPASNFTVTLDRTTGKITIAIAAGTMSIAWNTGAYGTMFRDLCGFTADFGPVASATGQNVAQYQVFAGSGRSRFPELRPSYTGGSTRARNGKVAVVRSSAIGIDTEWTHPHEAPAAVSSPLESGALRDTAGTIVPWTWHDFHDHHLALQAGEPFRYYSDRAGALTAYTTWKILAQDFQPDRVIDDRNTYWAVRLVVVENV